MRLLTRNDFLKEPIGILFSIYQLANFSGLKIKYATNEHTNNFYYMELIGNIKNDSSEDLFNSIFKAENGGSLELDFDSLDLDDAQDSSNMYAVYDIEDIKGLIGILNESLSEYNNKNTL